MFVFQLQFLLGVILVSFWDSLEHTHTNTHTHKTTMRSFSIKLFTLTFTLLVTFIASVIVTTGREICCLVLKRYRNLSTFNKAADVLLLSSLSLSLLSSTNTSNSIERCCNSMICVATKVCINMFTLGCWCVEEMALNGVGWLVWLILTLL